MASQNQVVSIAQPPEPARRVRLFCGHCGVGPDQGGAAPSESRVCSRCGLGVMLQATEDTAPSPADAFMVIDADLHVRAVSRRAERVLDATEPDLVDRHISELLKSAESNEQPGRTLSSLILMAATGQDEPETVPVRPAGEFGVRYWARISTCGNPTAALVLLFTLG